MLTFAQFNKIMKMCYAVDLINDCELLTPFHDTENNTWHLNSDEVGPLTFDASCKFHVDKETYIITVKCPDNRSHDLVCLTKMIL
jgi:hypothetical protein